MVDVWFLAGAAALGILLVVVKAVRCLTRRPLRQSPISRPRPSDGLRPAA
ncbi:MAG: hypothetical protein QM711_10670 [Micropruina sp.]